jgi:beta-lactamase class A
MTTHFSHLRRNLLRGLSLTPILPLATLALPGEAWANDAGITRAQARLQALEASSGGRLGVAASYNTTRIVHRADELFPFCSTFKLVLCSAVLERSIKQPELLQQALPYTRKDLVNYSPITEKYLEQGMRVGELCAAALQYSDNTAANLLISLVGGSAAVTAYARKIGDSHFRLDRLETALNTAIPGDPRDSATPASMAGNLQKLLLGQQLPPAQRAQLKTWMLGNTTGDARIRAGAPTGWQVADKTGTGDYGTSNDIAVLWTPSGSAVVLAIYFTQATQDAKMRNDVIAAATKIVLEGFALA